LIPYQVGRNQLLSRCRKSFSLSDNLVVVFQVLGLLPEMVSKAGVKISLLGDDKKIVYAGEKNLDNQRTALIEVETIPLSSLKPGYYTLNIDLLLEGKLVGSRRAELELSALPVVAAPVLVSRTVIQESEEWLLTGLQYLNTGNYREALRHIARAYGLQPGLREALAYAHVLLKLGDYSGMLEILKKYEQEDSPAELLSFLGQAYQSLNQPEKALFYYERYLDKFGINLDILNFAGTCYYQLGDKEKALSLWEKSLSLNPEQERLRELVRNLKKK
jgi:Tetratricopeptide repeat.